MDNLITLIVILIAVWSILSKYKAKRKKLSRAKPSLSSWMTTLKAFISDIQRQIEQQSKNRTGDVSGWDRFLDAGETYGSSADADEAAIGDRVLAEAQTVATPKKKPPSAPARAQPTKSYITQSVPAETGQKSLSVGQWSRTFITASRADLRRAVIWTEIIGPPLALRDRDNSR